MVNNIGSLLEMVGFKDLPYRFSGLSDTDNLDNIAITSEIDEDLFQKFEETIHSTYSENEMLNIYADPTYSELIEESDKIHEDTVNFFRYENGSPTTQFVDLLTESSGNRTLVLSSKDYLDRFREDVDSQLKNYADEFIGIYK